MEDSDLLLSFIREDAPFGDITSDAVIDDTRCRARIVAREDGVIAGLEEAEFLFCHYGVRVQFRAADGDDVRAGAVVIDLEGPARSILLVERTALNIIGRMSGIATMTRRLVLLLGRTACGCRIAATRKTAPGLRKLDKKAVVIGGGDPHRLSLSDGILIKDNHLALVPLAEAVRAAKAVSCYRKVEVEVTTPEEAATAADAGADIVLLDNMTPGEVEASLRLLGKKGAMGRVLVEVSGGIDEENLLSYALPGVDLISAGMLTHSVKNFNVSLDIVD
ncbi:MAG: carboxylating nicotinate-nucleotide diphosphorylase [Methanomicrobiales archaeon]|nr:carboxylating nicotinate-nucleotide diphosphorylase [Methanomicrobiales archaeon]NYT21359.1 carboxylating nicotinate-nucleotide diphosphorylase [Methanomicrobiales archaeon]